MALKIILGIVLCLYAIAYLSIIIGLIIKRVNRNKKSRKLRYIASWFFRISMVIRSFPILIVAGLAHLVIEETSMKKMFTDSETGGVKVYFYKYNRLNKLQTFLSGMSVFNIFLPESYDSEFGKKAIKHEYGHYSQLLVLGGWLFLLLVGIPSTINNLRSRKGKLKKNYYSYPWEKTADLLGGVIHTFKNGILKRY